MELKYAYYVIDSATLYAVGEQESSEVRPKFTSGRNVTLQPRWLHHLGQNALTAHAKQQGYLSIPFLESW